MPDLARNGRPDRQTLSARAALSAWLLEWQTARTLEQIAREDKAEQAAAPTPPSRPPGVTGSPQYQAAPYLDTARPAAGDIRLVYPHRVSAPTPARPIYLVVLEQDPHNRWHIAPFSRFATPAVPGEISTGLRPLALRVLCPWNGRWVGKAFFTRTWLAGRLTDRQAHLFRSAAADRCNANPPSLRRGPPLVHPLDPRWDYLREEGDAMQECVEANDNGSQGPAQLEEPADDASCGDSLLRAAESRLGYEAHGGKPDSPGPGSAPN